MLSKHDDEIVDIETIQDYVEKALIENGHAKTAKAYILYREKRKTAREMNALTGAIIGMFGNYLSDSDWQVQENANVTKSVNGLNNYVREEFTKLYWLSEIYPNQVSEMVKEVMFTLMILDSSIILCWLGSATISREGFKE